LRIRVGDTRLEVRGIRIAVFVILGIIDGSGSCLRVIPAIPRKIDVGSEPLYLDEVFQGNVFPEIGMARNDIIAMRHTPNIPRFYGGPHGKGRRGQAPPIT
jgi:hypothetical protein